VAKKTTQLLHVRIPKELHRRIQREADRHGQTINAEILKRLELSFSTDHALRVGDTLAEVAGRFEKAATNLQAATNAAIKVMVPDEKQRALVSEFLSGLTPDMAVRVIEDVAKKHKPEGDSNDQAIIR
jgi:hypothetical protein